MTKAAASCTFTGTIESKMHFNFAVSRAYCKDATLKELGVGDKPITEIFFGYCGLAVAPPYNYSIIATSYPDKGFVPHAVAQADTDARGWAVELEDTFLDCLTLASWAKQGDEAAGGKSMLSH